MRHLLVVVLMLSLANTAHSQDLTEDFWVQESYKKSQQEKLYKVSREEKFNLDIYDNTTDLANLPLYPVIKIDFFRVFNKVYYKDSKFTYVIPYSNREDSSGIGVRLRMSVAWSNN